MKKKDNDKIKKSRSKRRAPVIQLEHLSVMAVYVVLYIRLVNMVLKTAHAREIPGRVKGNRQYSRSFVYYCKLACSTVSLTGDRGRGDDSKQYRYYKSTYSTVQGFFFHLHSRSLPRRIVLSPPAIPLNCPPRTSGSAAVLRRYIELPI